MRSLTAKSPHQCVDDQRNIIQNIADIVQSAQHPELLEVSRFHHTSIRQPLVKRSVARSSGSGRLAGSYDYPSIGIDNRISTQNREYYLATAENEVRGSDARCPLEILAEKAMLDREQGEWGWSAMLKLCSPMKGKTLAELLTTSFLYQNIFVGNVSRRVVAIKEKAQKHEHNRARNHQ